MGIDGIEPDWEGGLQLFLRVLPLFIAAAILIAVVMVWANRRARARVRGAWAKENPGESWEANDLPANRDGNMIDLLVWAAAAFLIGGGGVAALLGVGL